MFVVQRHLHRGREGRLEDKYDLSPAESFGKLVYLLDDSQTPFEPAAAIKLLDAGLDSFSDEDFLLLIGNPVFIGAAVTIAADSNNGTVNVLQWNGKHRVYQPIHIDLN